MQELLTLAEMKERHPGEWVLVGDPQVNERDEIEAGIVLAHSEDRDIIYRKAMELRPQRSAFFCFKKLERGQAIVL